MFAFDLFTSVPFSYYDLYIYQAMIGTFDLTELNDPKTFPKSDVDREAVRATSEEQIAEHKKEDDLFLKEFFRKGCRY